MGFLKKLLGGGKKASPPVNPNRTGDLYALTKEGYLIAQDIACQYEYAENAACPRCGDGLTVMAQLNRASQGLNELVCTCQGCHTRTSFIFDISNEVYQAWMQAQFGADYVRNYEGQPRRPAR